MLKFKEFKECSDVTSIKDINLQYDYEDKIPQGKNDSPLVSCGQEGSYNELQYIYDEKLKSFVESGEITEKKAINALCLVCRDLKHPRERTVFYRLLQIELGINFTNT